MDTYDSKDIVQEIVANDGHYSDAPVPEQIHEYETPEGKKVWSVCYNNVDVANLHSSPYVKQSRLIWSKLHGWQLKESVSDYFDEVNF